MNDRYLFKAKRIDNGEWVQGHYVNCLFPSSDVRTGHFIVVYPGEYYEIYTSTLCQCTGLEDKNGKLIWENDIVGYCDGYKKKFYSIGIVEYGEFNCSCCDGVYGWYFTNGCDIRDYKRHEVIGNKFDNPELIEREVDR